jgi:hypothetical protein
MIIDVSWASLYAQSTGMKKKEMEAFSLVAVE